MDLANLNKSEEAGSLINFTKNGKNLSSIDMPVELLLTIFQTLDINALLSCRLVCKYWRYLIENDTLRKRFALALGKPIPMEEYDFLKDYFKYRKHPFDQNLINYHRNTEETVYGSTYSTVSCLYLPDLGFSKHVLDVMQPTIKISERFRAAKENCRRTQFRYINNIMLLNKGRAIMKEYDYYKDLEPSSKDWQKFDIEINGYGPGLRRMYCVSTRLLKFLNPYDTCKVEKEICIKLLLPEIADSNLQD